ncbi:MAG: hypothetical protein ACI30H_08965 [Paludibacteraceae bacterium]
MDAKQLIQEYENLFDWGKKEIKKYINGFDIKESIFDKFYHLENDIDSLTEEIAELKRAIKTL